MLTAYGIREKRELFVGQGGHQHQQSTFSQPGNIQDRFENLANYGRAPSDHKVNRNTFQSNNNTSGNSASNKESIIRNALIQFGEVLVKSLCQR